MAHGFPLFLLGLESTSTVIVGGGHEAERKAIELLDHHAAQLTVIAPAITDGLRERADAGTLTWIAREFAAGDLRDARLVFIDDAVDRDVAERAYREALAERAIVIALDDLPRCNAASGAVVRRGQLTVAISTAGAAPALAVRLKQRLEAMLGDDLADFLEVAQEMRPTIAARVPDRAARKAFWYSLVDAALSAAGAPVRSTEVVVPCRELDAAVAFFTAAPGFRLDAIFPADDPRVAVLSGHGLHLRLQRDTATAPGFTLRLLCDNPDAFANGARELTGPDGLRVQIVAADPPLDMPPLQPSLVVSKLGADSEWVAGRAGMRYRDLVPDRQGGRFIASHIHIAQGGPVPDYVHYHKVRFQMIYCYRGWVKVAYEDQGEAFVLHPGDCVLQPPQIRHRVLECSPNLEVVEIGCPADHETHADHELPLPAANEVPAPAEKLYGGQAFVRHIAEGATWQPWRLDGFDARDVGIGKATFGIAGVHVARARDGATGANGTGQAGQWSTHDAEFLFLFVLDGSVTLRCEGRDPQDLSAGDSVVIPAGLAHALNDRSADLQILEVALPAGFNTRTVEPR
ncbi:MAG: cupin domain-containing protein [Planctomycetota bacterium]